MHKAIKISPIIVFLIFYCILSSASASITFNYSFYIELGTAVICFLYFQYKKLLKHTNATIFASILLIFSAVYSIHGGSFAGYISKLMQVSLAVVLLNVKDDCRIKLLYTITKWFAVILAISLVFWVIHFFVPLPHITTVFDNPWGGYIIRSDYFFFRELENPDDIQRFQSYFLEPGHLGTIAALFLIVNQFDFKRIENFVYLLVIIVSLSAAAYVMIALGYLLFRVSEGKKSYFVYAILLLLALLVFFMNYNGGNNVVNDLIFSKLTRENGAVEGRVSDDVLSLYNNMWNTGKDLFFGKTMFLNLDTVGAGLILYFVQNGIFGTLLLALSYFSIYRSKRSRYGFYVLIIYYISFLQRTYPYWDAFTVPFILGLSSILYVQPNKRKRGIVKS